MKKYVFTRDGWNKNELTHVYSPVAKSYNPFTEEDDCIVSGYNKEIDDYDYISLCDRKLYTDGLIIRTKCSFDHFGAPLIVLADEIFEDEHGFRYGDNYEVVVWEGGCNIWHVIPAPKESGRTFISTAIAKIKFPIPEKSVVDLQVTMKGKLACCVVNGVEFDVRLPELPDNFYAGIAGCEGVNRFYEMEIEG